MKKLLKKLVEVQSEICITLALPTHRTAPDNQQDRINLKNLVSDVTHALQQEHGNREISALLSQLEKVESIDIQHNKEGLLIFINENTFEYARVLFAPEQRFIIDSTFATRDLIRQMMYEDNYYVLSLAQDQVRLFEGSGEYLDEVKDENFPSQDYSRSSGTSRSSQSNTHEVLTEEFFNRIDKLFFSEYYSQQTGHLVLGGTVRNIAHYMSVADHKNIILSSIDGSFDNSPAHAIAEKIWPVVKTEIANKRKNQLEELESLPTGMLSTDLSEIWNMIHEGRGSELYVEKSFIQAGVIAENNLNISLENPDDLQNDVVDEIIEAVLQHGGAVHFMDDGTMDKYGRIALSLRY